MDYLPLPTTNTACEHELYAPLSLALCRELRLLLAPEEILAGCQVYEVAEEVLSPTLPRGSYAVVQPLAPAQWPTIQPSEHCLITVEYLADGTPQGWENNFLSNEWMRVTANWLRTKGTLVGVTSKDDSDELDPCPFVVEEYAQPNELYYLREVGRVLRVILLPTV